MSNYSIQNYAQMMADPVRTPAYLAALKELITPSTVVLDLGAGTGLMALQACKYGAKRVYAVETNAALHIAQELALENAWRDRINFFQQDLATLKLPEKVDLIVSDLRGRLPFYGQHLELIKFAQQEFLKPDGVILPAIDSLFVALCGNQQLYQKSVAPWSALNIDISTQALEKQLSNCFYPTNINQIDLASIPMPWVEINYHKLAEYTYQKKLKFEPSTREIYGFFVWFDCRLTPNISYSCGPESNNQVYGSAFFPFEKKIKLEAGQHLTLDLSANYIAQDYVWRWKTALRTKVANNSWQERELYDQSNFLGLSFSEAGLQSLAGC